MEGEAENCQRANEVTCAHSMVVVGNIQICVDGRWKGTYVRDLKKEQLLRTCNEDRFTDLTVNFKKNTKFMAK